MIPFRIEEIVYYELVLILVFALIYFFSFDDHDFSERMSFLDSVFYSFDIASGVGNAPIEPKSQKARLAQTIQIALQFFILIPMIRYGIQSIDI
jgi:hypothetical protein